MSNVTKYKSRPTIYGTGLVSLDVVVSADIQEPSYHWAGGTCGNVLTILGYLGWKSYPIARLNGDTASQHVRSDMKRWGVDLSLAEQTPTTSTPIITQEISQNKKGEAVHKFHWKNCPECGAWLPTYKAVTLSSTSIIKDKTKAANVFFFDRVSPGALDLAQHFKKLGAVIFFEPSAKSSKAHLEQALKIADVVKYSNQRMLSEIADIKGHTSAFLEIQTLGSDGLKFRSHRKFSIPRKWSKLPPFLVESVKDTCGCGDWTTAGIISKICPEGIDSLQSLSEDKVIEALKYGQALGAWNCNFEGARGGMYRVSKSVFAKDIEQIMTDGVQKPKKYSRILDEKVMGERVCICK